MRVVAYLSLSGSGRKGGWVGAYSRWALNRGWALIRINTIPVFHFPTDRVPRRNYLPCHFGVKSILSSCHTSMKNTFFENSVTLMIRLIGVPLTCLHVGKRNKSQKGFVFQSRNGGKCHGFTKSFCCFTTHLAPDVNSKVLL